MPTIVHKFAWPDRVVVGTVGQPGSRKFYLQVRTRSDIVSIALEKEQSALLAEKIDEILDQLMNHEGNPLSIPATTPVELVDNDPLEQPVDEQFRTGALSLGWDPSTAQVVIEAYPLVESEEDAPDTDPTEPVEMLLVRLPVGTARAFAKRTREIVGAGRPMCPYCGDPMDPDGHACILGEH
ncbi:hypothetical protein GY21_08120 [Cryobacterium roopkundense]|uniref:Putative repeat protein (TIGR03847 family) n=1 Tax=Cryobacterium roopkundense TaxID=1001240 RepID=A0A099JI63_9MICO|nr:DUF3090 domain-containing protein [Cryobacterium roopkundense]KGJ77118.1 hypothetical protein GY21_08120 [Cryobacterium roopkundense]MBB5641514.1 putative repeat protein (TIGR03847 family) [Cryobacterium roopkundense]